MTEPYNRSDWQPDQYLKFQEERTQPAIDLARRVELGNVGRIMDLGCGPGNSTAVLAARWPDAEIVGIDSSAAMLEQARKTSARVQWVHHDAARDMDFLDRFDLIFSNAALQWIPDTENLVPRLYAMLTSGGALAIQVPCNHESPSFEVIREVVASPAWVELLASATPIRSYHDYSFYYDLLSRLSGDTVLWQTEYIHILESRRDLAEWYKGTGLRPYLDVLSSDSLRERFLADFTEALAPVYPNARNGKVLFPFKRLFFIHRRDS